MPTTIKKEVRDLISVTAEDHKSAKPDLKKDLESMSEKELTALAKKLTKQMQQAATELNFELAAELRDELKKVKEELRDLDK